MLLMTEDKRGEKSGARDEEHHKIIDVYGLNFTFGAILVLLMSSFSSSWLYHVCEGNDEEHQSIRYWDINQERNHREYDVM